MDARHGRESPSVEAGLLNPDPSGSACVDGAFWKFFWSGHHRDASTSPAPGIGAAQDRKRQEP